MSKGTNVVILKRNDYTSKLSNILEDISKFKRVNVEEETALGHLIHMEEQTIRLLKRLEDQGEISEKERNGLYPSGSKPGGLNGLAKFIKTLEDGIPSFCPIVSAIGTPTYNLAKFCDQLLKPLTNIDYLTKDSSSFVEEVLDFDTSSFMASFDIKSLSTNIPLRETLNLCLQNLYRNQARVKNLTKSSFYKLVKITMFESIFIFDGKFYEQCDGVTMGSTLGSALANVFIRNFESIWLENCPSLFKPIVYRRFVDDKFLLFRSKDHVEKFRNCLNKQYKNIKVTSEIGENSSLSFLDIKISRENNKFVTSVYCKPTFSGVFTNFESFIFLKVNLLHRSFRLCSNYERFSREIETLKSILKRNSYPHNLVNHCIKKFLNKLFVQRDLNFTIPKRELICVLPYLGKASLDLRTKLKEFTIS